MKKSELKTGRRGFLLGAGAAGVTGAAVIAGKSAGTGDAVPAARPDTKGRGGGYHVTEHVRSYYRSTLV